MDDETRPLPAELLVDREPISEDDWVSIMQTAEAEAEQYDETVDEVLAAGSGTVTAAQWRCETERDANWAMSRLSELHAQTAEPEALYEQWRQRLEDWLSERTKEQRRRASFLEGQLVRWALEQRAANPKRATFKFVSGVIRTTAQKEAVEIASQEAVIEWAKATHPDLVQTVERVLVSELRDHASVVETVQGTRVRLSCDHEVYVTGESARGEVVACSQCTMVELSESDRHGWKAPDGDIMRPVEEVLDVEVEVGVVAGGEPIPGTTVRPARTNVTVKPLI